MASINVVEYLEVNNSSFTLSENIKYDDLTKDVDDLDAVYMEKLRKDGIDEDLLAQFRDLTLELEKDKEQNG